MVAGMTHAATDRETASTSSFRTRSGCKDDKHNFLYIISIRFT